MRIIRMSSLDLSGKRVLIREDLNVPIQDGVVTSDARIRAALPTIQAALTARARVLVMSHLGRPEEGKYAEEFSLAPVAKRLAQLLGVPVALKKDWLSGVDVHPGEVVLLENVRFNKGEKKDADDLAQKMAALCEAARFDRARLAELLDLLAARKFEQDPVRLAFLTALASLPLRAPYVPIRSAPPACRPGSSALAAASSRGTRSSPCACSGTSRRGRRGRGRSRRSPSGPA